MIDNHKLPTVECVVINYKRPENIPLILRRFREQSHLCTVTLVDQSEGLAPETYDLAHRVYILKENYGPWNRFVPAGNYHCDYTYFHDSDMLPGRDLIKHFLTHAECTPEGALFGQGVWGRMCKDGYHTSDPPVLDHAVPVSLVIRGYFLRTQYLWALLKFASHFKHPILEDDIALAWSIYMYTDKLIYATPTPANPAELMNEQELSAPHACCARSGHYLRRDQFWKKCEKLCREVRESQRIGIE